MVLGQILKVGSVIIKHRKAIYAVLTAQDRYIDKAMKAGRYGLQARRGVRHGALAGSVIGSFINNAPDSPGNGIQTPFFKQPKTSKPYQTRRRSTKRYYPECPTRKYPRQRRR